jgi:hypothetical protein
MLPCHALRIRVPKLLAALVDFVALWLNVAAAIVEN